MNRYFCMLDSVDTLSDQHVVLNVQTKCNIPQALAEGIIQDASDAVQLKKAMKQSSDYMEIIWYRQTNPYIELTIDVESGETNVWLDQNNKSDQTNLQDTHPTIHLKEHEFSHKPMQAKLLIDRQQEMLAPDRPYDLGAVKMYLQRFNISNRDNPSLPDKRKEYYNRTPINWNIMVAKAVTDTIDITTVSRKCELMINYKHAWQSCRGALINKSAENQIESLEQIKHNWS